MLCDEILDGFLQLSSFQFAPPYALAQVFDIIELHDVSY